jgi:hypothetical protein
MRPIPLSFLTMYADLAQNVGLADVRAGSVTTRTMKGRPYIYVTSKDGGTRKQRSLGPADDPKVKAEAERIRQAAEQAKALRSAVSALKQARVPAPSLPLGRVLEVVANAGLFERGVVLIGTAAYQAYACIVGAYLPGAAITTNDADLLVASFVGKDERQDMEAILQRADPTFRARMQHEDRLPKAFRADNNFSVDILTKFGRGRKSPILIEELGCSAEALPFMEYLAEESMEAVALYGPGVLVRVPPPLRFAAHKLLIAPERRGRFLAKKPKDLAQARELIDIFLETDSDGLEDALNDARARGPKWKRNIGASLQEIGRDARQGRLPLRPAKPARKKRAR